MANTNRAENAHAIDLDKIDKDDVSTVQNANEEKILRVDQLMQQHGSYSKRSSIVAFADLPPSRRGTLHPDVERENLPEHMIYESRRKSLISIKSFVSVASAIAPTNMTRHHVIVFILTYCSYMLFHAMRKTLSTVKASMKNTWIPENSTNGILSYDANTWTKNMLFTDVGVAQDFLGALDAIFMFCYAIGLFISGLLGDRFEPRLVLTIGMCSTAVINFLFGYITEFTEFYSVPLYVFLWILNGFMQAAGWPTVVCIMGNWFGRGGRGLVLGFWSSCQSMGNILGAFLTVATLDYGYEYAFLLTSSLLFAGGIITFFTLISSPTEIGIHEPDERTKSELRKSNQRLDEECSSVASEKRKPISFLRAVLLPGVIAYSLAYGCLKLVNYSILFWLPYYLHENFGWKDVDAAAVSSYYDWGGVIGGTIGGIVSDIIGKRSPVVCSQLALSIIAFGFYTLSPNDQLINGVLMGIVGFFVSGAANLISAAVSADLGKQPAVRGSAEALSTVSGIVDGTGSAGAAIGQIFIPLFEGWFGWNSIFYMFMIMLLVACMLLGKLCYREIKDMYTDVRLRALQLASSMGERLDYSFTPVCVVEKIAL